MTQKRPPQLKDLLKKVYECIEHGNFSQSRHAIQRQTERNIELEDALYVLKTGYHEKAKTTFDEIFQGWKYAIRGKRLIRKICASS